MAADKTQTYIIRQNSVTNAVQFWQKDDTKTVEKVLETAIKFENHILRELSNKNTVEDLPKFKGPDKDKPWLNFNTPDYNRMLDYIKRGGTISQVRNPYKVSNEVAEELLKAN